MKVNLKIISSAVVLADTKCEELQEKILVKKMMLRRRLTRSSRIAVYLASKVGYGHERIVFGTAYGEVNATADIIESIYNKTLISPTAFQNSVHNTPVSYLSMLSENMGEMTTVSDLFNTSLSVLKTGAIKALKGDRILLLNIDAFNFKFIEQMNRCGVSKLESGVALMVEVTQEEANIYIEDERYGEVSPSLWQMLEIYNKAEKLSNPVLEVEI
ncbi:beta-ketoacyl synthase chain length factor [Sulfurovum sp. bin170]|uniref:beta-ketoacyl synthase chain length factor n=1 Tax=Sulfurovum sp. bin170 TaxID=2695268 RepID=UPI0013E05C3B|nr:beta-ketoacyl synthase chain length factor [Sulfurovum sp. bin170]NEW60922.1 beta-ketoacyl synthase chain length factor [Sulfurovum sp. bin170]